MLKKFWLIWIGLGLLLTLTVSAGAQGEMQVLEQSIESEFRDHISAHLKAEGPQEIVEVEFFYRVQGRKATARNVADFEPGKSIEAEFNIDQTSIYFPPGAELEYWWKITDAEGHSLKTDRKTYLYLDSRHDFKTLSNERISLYWYKGGDDFGEALFEQANKGLDQLEENVGVSVEQPVKIFIYGNHNDLMDAISVGAQEWTGGQAFTDQGVVVMGVAPNNLSWGLKATTHELTHLVIHQATDNPYGDLPRWLDEGLAVYNEDPDRLDSQFRYSFEAAIASDSLMTLQTLSSTFPADSQAANLAYGESGAVVKFIIDSYGTDAMTRMLEIFSEGSLYDDALEEALGLDTTGLDNAWRGSLGLPALADTQTDLDSGAEALPQSGFEATKEQATPALKTTPESASSPQNETGTETETEAQKPGLPCLAVLLPIVVLSAISSGRKKRPHSSSGAAR